MPSFISLGAFLGTTARGATTEHHSHVGNERAPGQRQSGAQSVQQGGHAVQLCRQAKTTYIMGVQKASLSPCY